MVCCTSHWPCSTVWLPPVHCGLPTQKRFPRVVFDACSASLDTGIFIPLEKKNPNTGLPTARAQSWGLGTCVPHQQWVVAQVAYVTDMLSPRDAPPERGPSAAGHLRGSLQMLETLQGSLPQSYTPSRSGGRVQNPPGLNC